jgi:NAD-dependent dihydropyrimidine dehydrogenase PreA subunit
MPKRVLQIPPVAVVVDTDKCTGCSICSLRCPTLALDIVDRKAIWARPYDCMGCQLCEVQCPVQAITVQRAILRMVEQGAPIAVASPQSDRELLIQDKPRSHYFRSEAA